MEVMNRPCEFDEYLNIIRQHMLEQSRTPEFVHNYRRELMNHIKGSEEYSEF